MAVSHAPAEAHEALDAPPAGRWLRLARLAWLALAGLLLVLLIAAAPRALAGLQAPCVGRICLRGQVHMSAIGLLEARGITVPAYGAGMFALQVSGALVCFIVAGVIFRRRPDDWMALLGAATLLTWGVTAAEIIVILDGTPIGWWCVRAIELLGTALLTYFCYLFPSGRFVPRWTRWLAPVWIAGVMLQYLPPATFGPNPLLGRLTALFLDAWMGSLALAQLYRYRRAASPAQRRQTRWVIAGIAATFGGFALVDMVRLASVALALVRPIPPLVSGIAYYSLMPLVPLAFGIAILRARLYDIELVVNRTLVYGALTACVVGVYVLVVGYLGALFHAEGNLAISLVATGLVAVMFQPLRARLQRGINRLMYGDRADPYAVISRLGQQLATALAPDAVLPTIVQTVREALKLPYVAITLQQEGGFVLAAASPDTEIEPRTENQEPGTEDRGWRMEDSNTEASAQLSSIFNPPSSVDHLVTRSPAHPLTCSPSHLVTLPLTYQGETVGQLLLAPRPGESSFSAADRRLLADLARQASTAVYAIRLTLDLQHARARLVTAREEERRRLRRDLHDGLGPVLAALALQADTARELVRSEPDEAVALLDELTGQAQAAVVDIRRLVYALRPPALDDLGLVVALRSYANAMTHGGMAVAIEAPEPFPALPAAVEVAAYRIVQEAVTNVARHAQARRCTIRLAYANDATPAAHLQIVVMDDGRGIPANYQAGIGLTSMRERARELGGDCRIEAAAGGTIVSAWLPFVLEIRD